MAANILLPSWTVSDSVGCSLRSDTRFLSRMELVTFYEFALKACAHCVYLVGFVSWEIQEIWLNCGKL